MREPFVTEDRLQEIAEILKLGHKASIEAAQRQALAGSSVRQSIYELCDGTKSVGEIARVLRRTIQQVSNNIAILQSAGLVSEVRKGKEKYYVKMRESKFSLNKSEIMIHAQ